MNENTGKFFHKKGEIYHNIKLGDHFWDWPFIYYKTNETFPQNQNLPVLVFIFFAS